jgi:hypothetical protein
MAVGIAATHAGTGETQAVFAPAIKADHQPSQKEGFAFFFWALGMPGRQRASPRQLELLLMPLPGHPRLRPVIQCAQRGELENI